MKKLVLLMFAAAMAFAVQAQEVETEKVESQKEEVKSAEAEKTEKKSGPVITFKEKSKDFGDITQGDKVQHTFKLTNTGNEVLKISNVAATCGCTVPSWPKEPIAPGESAEIKVTFNSAGKMGKQNSVVRIYSNATEPIEKVSLISNVKRKG
ncbi:DUF1573 domain-containing protein [Echinicola jeungdonensis]|uniref:DUF1573 domain-containing protein n=1 Tax=Echinicola jeungdonensis TaxID=709343 RepID=A0ABV5JA45_9BACT|nr:DUF1573 domain-containing protein [Echinicola jeungdonensis]MDN3669900.1 DUF1573 domain-containing protein [Echinicola jeungdonensis]